MSEDRHDPVRQAVGRAGQSAKQGIVRQLSELARELQADVTAEAFPDGQPRTVRGRADRLTVVMRKPSPGGQRLP